MRRDLYVIEARKPDGSLDFDGRQPHGDFGMGAIHGMSEDAIAQVIFRKLPEATLSGMAGVTSWGGDRPRSKQGREARQK